MHIGVVSLKEKLRSFKWNQPLVGEKRVLPLKGSYQTAPICIYILYIRVVYIHIITRLLHILALFYASFFLSDRNDTSVIQREDEK